ncbi:hypothetical protein [Nonomuraea sp. KM90]|uniref:hypothetical protein n=1 Tax=Nonomuraea sp. KM90 TaxID=3457428 RepID=UPI003FCC35C7
MRVRSASGIPAVGMATAACAPTAEQATSKVRGVDKVPVAATVAQPPTETLMPLPEQSLPNLKGNTFTRRSQTSRPVHARCHIATTKPSLYVYVLDGAIRSRLSAHRQGEGFVEPPGSRHVLPENISRTEPARLLVILISNPGDETTTSSSAAHIAKPSCLCRQQQGPRRR